MSLDKKVKFVHLKNGKWLKMIKKSIFSLTVVILDTEGVKMKRKQYVPYSNIHITVLL